jgi:hypothetical protein
MEEEIEKNIEDPESQTRQLSLALIANNANITSMMVFVNGKRVKNSWQGTITIGQTKIRIKVRGIEGSTFQLIMDGKSEIKKLKGGQHIEDIFI